MNSAERDQYELEIRHLTRRLENRPMDSSRGRVTQQVMAAKDAMVRAQMERDRALKENSELRARLALLEGEVARMCA